MGKVKSQHEHKEGRAGAYILRHMAEIVQGCKTRRSERRSAPMIQNRGSAPCAFDVPIPGNIPHTPQTVARDSEMRDLRRESPVRLHWHI